MYHRIAFLLTFLLWAVLLPAQYEFTVDKDCRHTSVKSQDRTGTCWSFATTSFLESELLRMGKGEHDLSEMFTVRTIYEDKARNYILRQGKANFGQGSLAHDVLRAVSLAGVVPQEVYSGLLPGQKRYDHSEMEAVLKGMLDGVLKGKHPSPYWPDAFRAVLDVYMQPVPEHFNYRGKSYTPRTFAESLGISPDDYISFTSFTHHPFYTSFVLEIPDNYSNGSYYNLPLDELVAVVDEAIAKGYTVAWDGDVSEEGFSARAGLAVLPADPDRSDLFTRPGEELKVTQDMRQQGFMDFSTTDDHLMHIVGMAHDQNGTKYYIVKNSWGKIGPYGGVVYISEAYFRMKTIAVTMHKSAVNGLGEEN